MTYILTYIPELAFLLSHNKGPITSLFVYQIKAKLASQTPEQGQTTHECTFGNGHSNGRGEIGERPGKMHG